MMLSGGLRTIVEFQRPVKSRGTTGEELVTYESVARRFAKVIVKGTKEREVAALQVEGSTSYEVRVRHETALADLSYDWRLIINGATFHVKGIENIQLRNLEYRVMVMQHD